MPSLLPSGPAAAVALTLSLALSGAAGCGSRSDLDPFGAADSGEQGGGTTTSGSGTTTPTGSTTSGTTGTTTTTVTGPVECSGLTVLSPLQVVPTPGEARAPELQVLPATGEALLAYIEAPPGASGLLRFSASAAFAEWPPPFSGFPAALENVVDFATGPGPEGPVGYIRRAGDLPVLASQLYPDLVKVDTPFQPGDGEISFVAAIPDRYLAAELTAVPGYHVLGVGSYQPGGLPQSEDPLVCTTNRILGAGVPAGQGFLAAFTQPSYAESCIPAEAGTIAQVGRYDAPPEPGSSLKYTEGSSWVSAGQPLVHLAMAATSSGAWLAFQTDGSTSEVPPPVFAIRLDMAGEPIPGEQYIPVMPAGFTPPAIAAAAVGDNLAVAWVDNIDPGPPLIALQLVRPDGSLGPATSFPTSEAWATGRLRLLASPAQNSLLVAWETSLDGHRVALARIDCIGGL